MFSCWAADICSLLPYNLEAPAQALSHMLGIFWFMAQPIYQLFQLLRCSKLINASIILHILSDAVSNKDT